MGHTDSVKNPVSAHSSKQAKFQPGQGDSAKSAPMKPIMKLEKPHKAPPHSPLQEYKKFVAVNVREKQAPKMSPASRHSETASLISTGSLDEFDKPVESKPVRRSMKEYQGKQQQQIKSTDIPEVKVSQEMQQKLQVNVGAALDFHKVAQTGLPPPAPLEALEHQLGSGGGRRIEYPRFIPLMLPTLARDANSWAGLPVGELTILHRPPSSTWSILEHQLPVYVIHQRLGLMTTSEELSAFGLQSAVGGGGGQMSILDAAGSQSAGGQVCQFRLSLFTDDLLTPEEALSMPFQVTTPRMTTTEAPVAGLSANWASTNTTTTVTTTNAMQKLLTNDAWRLTNHGHLYQEEIEVFGFFE